MRRGVVAALSAAALAALPLACGGVGEAEREAAVAAAGAAYAQARAAGIELSNGPCIADPLEGMPTWVVDIAHDPREDIDDDPANQCSSYRSGDADHFVELDPSGNLIRAR